MAHEHESSPQVNPTDQHIPHSGRHGYERPLREFDNTSLGEAVDMGLIETPDSPAPLQDPHDKKRRPRTPLIVGGSVLASAVLGYGGYRAIHWNDERGPAYDGRDDPAASAPVTPGETASAEAWSPAELVPDVKDIELTTAEFGADLTVEDHAGVEKLVRAWNDRYNEWMMTGATPEAFEQRDRGITLSDWVDQINEPVDEAYIEALFAPDWQQRPGLTEYISAVERIHHAQVSVNLKTSGGYNDQDIEPYEAGWTLTSAQTVTSPDHLISVVYHYERWDNAANNRGSELLENGSINGITGQATLQFEQFDGTWKLVYAGR